VIQVLKQQCLEQESELLPTFIKHYERLKTLPRKNALSTATTVEAISGRPCTVTGTGQAPALAATINVSGGCTLVRAIVAANNDTTASGNCTKGSGADTIVLPRNSTHRLTVVNTTPYGPTGLPVIRSVITIAGNGSTIRRTGTAPSFRIFAVGRTGNLRLQQTTVSGGAASPTASGLDVRGGVFVEGAPSPS
jgi:hypothetical protein